MSLPLEGKVSQIRKKEGGFETGTLALQCLVVASDRSVGGARAGFTYSVAPAAHQVVGQGVVRLQLDGFIQVILEGKNRAAVEASGGRRSRQRRLFSVPPLLT